MKPSPEFQALIYQGAKAGGCARKLSAAATIALAPWIVQLGDSYMSDAGELRVGAEVLLQTVDVITPLVPLPSDFGRIAAANAVSDIYAAGGQPIAALAIACVPDGPREAEMHDALVAGIDYLRSLDCPVLGGHSIRDEEAKLGFAVTGKLRSDRSLAVGAMPGDRLLLSKALGVGVIATGYKLDRATAGELREATDLMLTTHSWLLGLLSGPDSEYVHAATDISGYGLLGHSIELGRRSRVGVRFDRSAIPMLPVARRLAASGIRTSAHDGNLRYAGSFGAGLTELDDVDRILLVDPQTSGGALVAIASEAAARVQARLVSQGVPISIVGTVTEAGFELV
jgi:selenide,water dikinase